MTNVVHRWDAAVTELIGSVPESVRPFFVWLGRLTTPLLWLSAFTVVHAAWLSVGYLAPAALSIIILLPLASLMKLFFRRKRPPTLYAAAMKVKSYSFPSSHAYSAALAGGYLGAEAFAAGVVVVGIGLWLFAIVIGISRVYVGAHYPSDVLAGWVLGGGIAWFIATLF